MSIRHDLAFARRSLWRSPVLTITAVVSLAAGLAGTATVFSLTDALLFRHQAAIREPRQLVDVGRVEGGARFRTLSYPNYVDLRDRNTVFEGLAAYRGEGTPFGLTVDDTAIRVVAGQVSANYFDVLGVTMAAGRGFLSAEERNGDAVAVLGHALWRRWFEGDPGVIGRTVRLNGQPFTVVGVTPAEFGGYGLVAHDLWVPLTSYQSRDFARLTFRAGGWLLAIGRLQAGTTLEQARANLATIARALEREFPEANRGRGVSAGPSSAVPHEARPVIGTFMGLLFAMVTLVLLIACTNVAGILLARGAMRSREMAVRLALGAGRSRLIRLLLTEGVLLAAIGSTVGLAGAWAALRLLTGLVPVLPLDILVDFRLDWRVVAFSVCLAALAGVLCGLAPAFQGARVDLTASVRPDAVTSRRPWRVRQLFVVAQISMAVCLVICAALLARSLSRAASLDPGFVSEGVEVVQLDLRLAGYDETTGPVFAADLLSRIERLPGAGAVASARVVPLTMIANSQGVLWRPEQYGQREAAIDADWNIVTPRYFDAMQMAIVRGRPFRPADDRLSADVVIVNETLASRVWPGEDPIGRRLVYEESGRREMQVVGVARDSTYVRLGEGPQPFIYVPFAQHYHPEMAVLVKTSGTSVIPAVRALVREVAPYLPLRRASTLSEATAFGLVPHRLAALVAGAGALIGALLAALGVYGVTAHWAGQRTKEIGIRMALGAVRAHVVGMVVGQGALLAGLGVIVGAGLAAGVSQLLASLLFGVQPLDWLSFGAGILSMMAIAIGASLMPARRAASVAPMEALRHE
jgi:putative ABC transport system permease protein